MNEQKFNTAKIHFGYCTLILVLLLIFVATERWSAKANFTEYLSNAATMTSLLLGMVAIFYSFISNGELSKSLGNIASASDELRKSKDQMAGFLSQTELATNTSIDTKKELQALSSALDEKLSELHSTLDTVATKTGLLPTKFEELESKVLEAAMGMGTKPSSPTPTNLGNIWTKDAVTKFCQRAPLMINLLAYACVLAHKKGTELSLEQIDKAMQTNFAGYNSGAISTMHGCQLIERVVVKNKTRTFIVRSVDKELEQMARSYFVNYVETTFNAPDEGPEKARWFSRLSGLETLFQST